MATPSEHERNSIQRAFIAPTTKTDTFGSMSPCYFKRNASANGRNDEVKARSRLCLVMSRLSGR